VQVQLVKKDCASTLVCLVVHEDAVLDIQSDLSEMGALSFEIDGTAFLGQSHSEVAILNGHLSCLHFEVPELGTCEKFDVDEGSKQVLVALLVVLILFHDDCV
jgi:hypothetical protein